MNEANNKGYMLIEIILATVIAFAVAFFIAGLILKLKNKNDDIFVENQVITDKSIIANKIMEILTREHDNFNCNALEKNNQTIIYNGDVIDKVVDYAIVGDIKCEKTTSQINIEIPLEVRQMQEEDYNVYINYKLSIGDMINPICQLKVDETKITFAKKEDPGDGSGIDSFGLIKGNTITYNGKNEISIDSNGTYTGFVKDKAGNEGKCQVEVINKPAATSYVVKEYVCKNITPVVCWHEYYYEKGKQLPCYGTAAYACESPSSGCCVKHSYGADTWDDCIAYNKNNGNLGYGPVKMGEVKYEFVLQTTNNSATSCTEQNTGIACDKEHHNITKIECSANGGNCGQGYTQINNYCYKIIN